MKTGQVPFTENIQKVGKRDEYCCVFEGTSSDHGWSDGNLLPEKYKDEQIFVERANTEAPERVKEIHLDYIAAGAKLIRTNTFATNTMFLIQWRK